MAQATPRGAKRSIPGTPVFDGAEAMKGYAINQMCYSFNDAANRDAYKADPDSYCRKFGLTPDQVAAVKSLNVLAMLKAGGNVYYLAKLAGIYKLNVQDIGAQQTGKSLEDFKAMLLAHGAH